MDQLTTRIEALTETMEALELEKENGIINEGRYLALCNMYKSIYDKYSANNHLDKLDCNIQNIHFLLNTLAYCREATAYEYTTAITIIKKMKTEEYWSGYFFYTFTHKFQTEDYESIILNCSNKIYDQEQIMKLVQHLNKYIESNAYYGYQ